MDESEKKLLENIKNIDTSQLFKKNTYVNIPINDIFIPAYIINEKENKKFEVYIQNSENRQDIPSNYFVLFGEKECAEQFKLRQYPINLFFRKYEISDLLNYINKALAKFNIVLNSKNNNNSNCNSNNSFEKDNNSSMSTSSSNNFQNNNNNSSSNNTKIIDFNGYYIYQFLEGFILDFFSLCIENFKTNNFNINDKNLLIYILDIIIYLAGIVKLNLDKYKSAYYNRKLLIVSQIHSILISFDSLIYNLTPNFDIIYNSELDLKKKLADIANLVYEIILSSKNNNQIPLQCLIIFIKLICLGQVKDCIENYNKKEIYDIFNDHMKNLDKNELIYYKKDSSMKEICNNLVNELFDKKIESYIDETYYSYLLSCLKFNNLEKKMNALNDINNIINEIQDKKKVDNNFKDFIEKNNILEIFFEESTHDEVIKRSINIFTYLARYDCLSDNIIEKIIQRQSNNEIMKKILIDIISELPKEKKDILFNRLSQGLKLDEDNTNNIEYILELTKSCFNSSDIESEDNKEKEKEKEKENEKENENKIDIDDNENIKENNYYGLNLIFDYIIKYFNDKKKYDENNVDIAVNAFVDALLDIIKNSYDFDVEDIFFFIEKLCENIKSNNKHNSIIQSIKIILKLFNTLGKKKYKSSFTKNLKILDEKYDIISLLINDLIRYMNILPSDYSNEIGNNNVYEGIYPHYINVEQRLNLIFFFFKKNVNNYGLLLEGKKHIEKIYEIFKFEKFNDERKKFYSNITKNINLIDNNILMEFYQNIMKNKEEFDLKEIKDNEQTNLIIQTFKQINFNKKSIFYDGRNIRIGEEEPIEGTDMLFDLLTQNPNQLVQDKISQLLCDICLSHKNYKNVHISDFWKNYFNKINIYLDNIINTNDKIALNGIIKLIKKIYISSCNCYGKRPEKSDLPTSKDPYKIYNFINVKTKEQLRKKIGTTDKIIDIRWKMAYFFKMQVNNIAFIDTNEKIYTLNDDFENFRKIFSDERYFYNKGFEYVKVKEIPFRLTEMDDNPKILIETNDKIYNILINNLKIDLNNMDYNNEIINKQKIWNIISKLPKKYFFDNKMKKYGNKEKINDTELLDILDINQIYIITYSLQCFYFVLFDKTNENNEKEENEEKIDKNDFLKNFIEIYHMDKILIDKLLEFNIDTNNCHPIQIECLNMIIEVLGEFEKYKENKMEQENANILNDVNLYNNLIKKLTEIISNLLRLDFNIFKNYLIEEIDDLNEEEDEEDKEEEIIEDMNDKFEKLIHNIFFFINEITKNKVSFINYIFNDKNLFIKIFINEFIKCDNDSVKSVIEEYLSKNCETNNDTIKKYLEIILTEDIFNYLIKNDKSGDYFNVINSILSKIFNKKEIKENKDNKDNNKESEINIESNYIEQAKKLVDIILIYIQNELNKNEKDEKNDYDNMEEREIKKKFRNKENLKEGIILFLSNILNIKPKELVNYIIKKVDIIDFFLYNCILRKCVEKPLEAKEPFCLNNKSKGAIFELLLNILKNLDYDNDNILYTKIINILDNNNKLGFWKTFNTRNWEIESKDIQKGKYIGLKNMTSTCYLNSIIQQLFMIPTFRETILKIENPSKDNVLYELQLLFSALKIFEFPYYDPKSFVLANNLNFYEQMDADEFYVTLIDKIEKDIKKIHSNNLIDKNDKKNETYKYKDIFNYFFEIKVIDELQFTDCGHKRYNEFCYNNIQLEIKEFSNIYESLKNYFRTEIMEGDNKINCEQCKTKRICHKHLLLKSLPNILVISLKRFEFDYDTMLKYKLNNYFEFPLQLNMKDYLIENHTEKNTEYELTGITIHFGVSDYGHYYDLIKGPNNKWYKFNDTNINEFKEEDIPKEAYGEKESSEDDSYKEKENGRNNAYILFYTKKNNEIDKLNKTDLALPPYNRYSNIKKENIQIINMKLFKVWIIKNLFSTSYQNFVMGLLKIDIAKIIDKNIEKSHPKMTLALRNEGYIKNIKDNIDDIFKDKDKESDSSENIESLNDNRITIFQFGLRYYFNVILRVGRKPQDKLTLKNMDNFKELINIYIESDINKAKYILQEFSDIRAINEYLVYCPNGTSSDNCIEIISNAYRLLYKYNDYYIDENSIIYKFLNTWITFIANYIQQINLEHVNSLLYNIININSSSFKQYFKEKNIDKWVYILMKNINAPNTLAEIFNESNLPLLRSNHSILSEKIFMDGDDCIRPKNNEDDIYDQRFYHRLVESKSNLKLREELYNYLFDNSNK